jgi:uncharacterized protein
MDETGPAPQSSEPAAAGLKMRTFKREFSKFCLYCLIFYLSFGLLIAFSPLASLLILHPQGRSDFYNAAVANKEEVNFANAAGDTLHAWFIRAPGAKRIALVHHGNAGNLIHRLTIARDFLQLGTSVFLYDYRGYGASTGKPSVAGLIEDGLAAYDYVNKKLGYSPDQIIAYGESIGTAVTCRVALLRPCRAIVLQSGLSSLPAVAHDGVLWLKLYPDWVFPQPHFDTDSIIARLPEPILFIHGMKDSTIPYRQSEELFKLASNKQNKIVLLPDAGHNDVQGADEPQFYSALSGFVESVFSAPPVDASLFTERQKSKAVMPRELAALR